MGAFRPATGTVTDWTSNDNQCFIGVKDNHLYVGRACQHPTDAVRWDEHRALLRCTACGRKIEDGDQRSRRLTQGP